MHKKKTITFELVNITSSKLNIFVCMDEYCASCIQNLNVSLSEVKDALLTVCLSLEVCCGAESLRKLVIDR